MGGFNEAASARSRNSIDQCEQLSEQESFNEAASARSRNSDA